MILAAILEELIDAIADAAVASWASRRDHNPRRRPQEPRWWHRSADKAQKQRSWRRNRRAEPETWDEDWRR